MGAVPALSKENMMDRIIQYATKASLYNGDFGVGGAPWPAAGMGYVFVTADGQLTVVDGGHGEDAEGLLSLLSAVTGEDVPTVSRWIVTHPHMDHYGALREIAAREELRGRVTVQELWWYFPAEFRDRNGKAPCERANRHMEEIRTSLGAVGHTPRIGETAETGDLTLTVLFVPIDCRWINNPNSLSLIFKVTSPRKTVLITGDAFSDTLGYCAERYGTSLRADILQMPHHGLCDTGHEEFYRLVGADTLLVPISEAGERTMKSGIYGDATAANLVAEGMAETVHRAFEGTVSVPL